MDDDKKPKKQKRFKLKLPRVRIPFILFWVFIIVMISGFVVTQVERNNELQSDLLRLQTINDNYLAERHSLELRLTFFDSEAYIEDLARNRLGMVRPNEIVFRNIAAE
jgi:cell division protein FtsB